MPLLLPSLHLLQLCLSICLHGLCHRLPALACRWTRPVQANLSLHLSDLPKPHSLRLSHLQDKHLPLAIPWTWPVSFLLLLLHLLQLGFTFCLHSLRHKILALTLAWTRPVQTDLPHDLSDLPRPHSLWLSLLQAQPQSLRCFPHDLPVHHLRRKL